MKMCLSDFKHLFNFMSFWEKLSDGMEPKFFCMPLPIMTILLSYHVYFFLDTIFVCLFWKLKDWNVTSNEQQEQIVFTFTVTSVYLNQKQYICSREWNMVFMETPNLILGYCGCAVSPEDPENPECDLRLCLHIGLCHFLLGSTPGQR